MVLPWIQVTFKCYDNIQYHIWKFFFSVCMAGLMYMLAHDWKKRTLGEVPYVRRV